MNRILGTSVAIIVSLSSFSATARETNMAISLECPPIVVVDFPALVTLSLRGMHPSMPGFAVSRLDLASVVDQGMDLELTFQSNTGSVAHIGYRGPGRPEVEFVPPPPRFYLNGGEEVLLTFDVNQLLFGAALRARTTLSESGKYRITAIFFTTDCRSVEQNVTIRQPTADEKRFLDAIQKQGIRKKWFPAVILNDKMEVPDDIPLPAETALLRDFIKVLRLAVRNPDVALKEIEDRKETWGYMQDIVAELKYECITKSKGKDSTVAQVLRRSLDADPKMKGRLTRIEKGGGLLDHFAEMKAAKPKEK